MKVQFNRQKYWKTWNIKNEKFNKSNNNKIVKGLSSKIDQREDTIAGPRDKLYELKHSDNDTDKLIRKYKQNICYLWDTMKRLNIQVMGIKEKEF